MTAALLLTHSRTWQVKDIIVCGHMGFGGVKAATLNKEHGLIDHWLRQIRDVQRLHFEELQVGGFGRQIWSYEGFLLEGGAATLLLTCLPSCSSSSGAP